MLYATNRFPGDGVTTQYEISFVGGYLDRTHVKAYIEDASLVQTPVPLTQGNFLGPFTIRGIPPIPVGSTLVIYRDTPKAPIVDFVNGSRMTEANLDTATRQGAFIAAEGTDAVSPTGLEGVIQQVTGFAAAAGVARDEAVAAKNTVVASADAALLAASNAEASNLSASASASSALTNKDLSASFSSAASASAGAASASAGAASASASSAASALATFGTQYLGAKSAPPTTDNEGAALLTGAMYWDTTLPGARSWSGTSWVTLPAATAASVGLGNVDNTPDNAKPVSTAQAAAIQTANIYAAVPLTNVGPVVIVTSPHLRVMIWNVAYGYVRAPWHQPGMVMHSIHNPASIPGYLPVRGDVSYQQSDYPDLSGRLGLSGSGTFTLVEARGEFIRVLDNGRGVDTGRVLRAAQGDAIRNIQGSIAIASGGTWLSSTSGSGVLRAQVTGASVAQATFTSATGDAGVNIDASRTVPTAAENRPRNIALPLWVSY